MHAVGIYGLACGRAGDVSKEAGQAGEFAWLLSTTRDAPMPTWNFKAASAVFIAPVALAIPKACSCCGKSHVATTAYAAISGTLLMFNCECGSTLGVKLST